MKILYLECNMGAAGDMLTASLSELSDDAKAFEKRFNALGIPSVSLRLESSEKCGIRGTYSRVCINGENGHHGHHHNHLADIEHLISHLDLPVSVKDNAIAVYRIIAEAEGYVHGCEMDNIHFHEVGTMDAVSDVVGVCMLIDELNPDRIIASPVAVGSGQVSCAHGILPVPTPATAYILRDVPIYSGCVTGELCTPTGAALLKHFVSEFAPMPVMKTNKIGYGMGKKDFETANCVRAFLGQTQDNDGQITELRCNVDDMTGEEIGFATEELLSHGALDVFTAPIYMKKNRPGVLITVLCGSEQREEMIRLIFTHTTTIGIREYSPHRSTLSRTSYTVKTAYGDIKAKRSEGYGVIRHKVEYDDLSTAARKEKLPLKTIRSEVEKSIL